MKKALTLLLFVPLWGLAQLNTYSGASLYDQPGGLYEEDSLRTIQIDFLDPNYHSILTNSFFNDPKYRIPATVTINGVAHDSVGVRYKGNSTFCIPNDDGVPKLPLNLDMNHWVSGQKLMDYKKLKLANAYMDATFAREYIASQVYRKYLPTPEVNLTKVNVQGSYLGLYVNTESINKQFAEKHFDEKDGVLFKCDNAEVFCGSNAGINAYSPDLSWINGDSTTYYDTYDLKSDKGWQEMLTLMYTLEYTPSMIDSVLNVDRVLWAFAVNNVMANFDAYNCYYVHNYYLYQTEDGLFQMIPWDLSQTFLNALLGNDMFTPLGPTHPTQFDPYAWSSPGSGRPLTEVLLNDPMYRDQYTAHLRTILDEIDTNYIRNEVTFVQNLGYDAMVNDQHKMFSSAQFSSNVESDLAFWPWGGYGFGGIMSTYKERREYLLGHPEISQVPPTITNVDVQNDLITAEVSNETVVELMATTNAYNSKFRAYNMMDDGTNGDLVAGDGIFTAPVPASGGNEVKFYIRAQNNEAMKLSPQRAEYEFYTYTPATGIFERPEITNSVNIYPNPANDVITVESTETIRNFSIQTISGQVVLVGTLGQTKQINISNLPPNVYIVTLDGTPLKLVKTN